MQIEATFSERGQIKLHPSHSKTGSHKNIMVFIFLNSSLSNACSEQRWVYFFKTSVDDAALMASILKC